MIVERTWFHDGRRTELGADDHLDRPGGLLWIGLHEPSHEELDDIANILHLHPLAVEDAMKARQRPKVERYEDSWFVVLRPATYVDAEEMVEISELMLFVADHFVVAVCHGPSGPLTGLSGRLDELAFAGQLERSAILHTVADAVVDGYSPVVEGIAQDIDQIEHAVFSGPKPSHGERIFKLKREVLQFRAAVDPLLPAVTELGHGMAAGPGNEAMQPYFRDVEDHLRRISERLHGLDVLLDAALSANVAQVGLRQNEDMRKISAWVAIAALPTMMAGIWGMNFEHMPELHSRFGYPIGLASMALVCIALYRNFKRRGWL